MNYSMFFFGLNRRINAKLSVILCFCTGLICKKFNFMMFLILTMSLNSTKLPRVDFIVISKFCFVFRLKCKKLIVLIAFEM